MMAGQFSHKDFETGADSDTLSLYTVDSVALPTPTSPLKLQPKTTINTTPIKQLHVSPFKPTPGRFSQISKSNAKQNNPCLLQSEVKKSRLLPTSTTADPAKSVASTRKQNPLSYALIDKLPQQYQGEMRKVVDYYQHELAYYIAQNRKLDQKLRATKKPKREPCLYIDPTDLWDIHELRIHNQEKSVLTKKIDSLEKQLGQAQPLMHSKDLQIQKLKELIEENNNREEEVNRQKYVLVESISLQEIRIEEQEREIKRLTQLLAEQENRKKNQVDTLLQLKQDRSYLTDQLASVTERLQRELRSKNQEEGMSEKFIHLLAQKSIRSSRRPSPFSQH